MAVGHKNIACILVPWPDAIVEFTRIHKKDAKTKDEQSNINYKKIPTVMN